MIKLDDAQFIGGWPTFGDLPLHSLFEVAVFGRSNAGKSTFINKTCNRKSLAISSSTPGRTKECNFFKLTYQKTPPKKETCFLVDTPGYGYSKFDKELRHKTGALLEKYLVKRDPLKLIILIADGRREITEQEEWIRDVAHERNIRFLFVPTKLDTLSRMNAINRGKELLRLFGLEESEIFLDYFEVDSTGNFGKDFGVENLQYLSIM